MNEEVVITASPSFPGIYLRKEWKFSVSTADAPINVSTGYIRNTVRNRVKITTGSTKYSTRPDQFGQMVQMNTDYPKWQ